LCVLANSNLHLQQVRRAKIIIIKTSATIITNHKKPEVRILPAEAFWRRRACWAHNIKTVSDEAVFCILYTNLRLLFLNKKIPRVFIKTPGMNKSIMLKL